MREGRVQLDWLHGENGLVRMAKPSQPKLKMNLPIKFMKQKEMKVKVKKVIYGHLFSQDILTANVHCYFMKSNNGGKTWTVSKKLT